MKVTSFKQSNNKKRLFSWNKLIYVLKLDNQTHLDYRIILPPGKHKTLQFLNQDVTDNIWQKFNYPWKIPLVVSYICNPFLFNGLKLSFKTFSFLKTCYMSKNSLSDLIRLLSKNTQKLKNVI